MTPTHVEAYLDAALAALRSGLPGTIAALNSGYSDFTLDAPEDDAYVAGVSNVVKFPTVEVAIPDLILRGFSLGNASALGDLGVVVKVSAADYDPQRLYRRLLRYGRAVYAVLAAPGAVAGADINPDGLFRASYRFNPETDTGEEALGGALLLFPFQVVESTP